jgi:hypothetical protein
MAVNYTDISSKVRQAVESITAVRPNFTIIKYRKQKNVASAAEHDRTIFTNLF